MKADLRLAVGLTLAGSTLALVGVGRVWSRHLVTQAAPLPARTVTMTGQQLAGGIRPLALVGLVAVVALVATRRTGRLLVGLVVAAAGAGIAYQAAESGGSGWAWVTRVAGVLVAVAGVLVVARGRRWDSLSSAYQVPAARPVDTVSDKGVWDALDRGEDPTA